MKFILSILVFVTCYISPFHLNAQKTSPTTLLWRISGNGLQKPSYLYGTMHLKDRRLFFFGDSVYKSLEAADGFAMELDPAEMMDSIFSRIGDADTSTLLRKLLDQKKFKSVSKKLEKKFGMPADKISRKQMITERDSWYQNIHKSDDMQSVVDLYLYNIAHKQAKWVGGIEDVNDQLGILDELGKNVNISDYVDDDNIEKRKSYLENMINLYANEDVGQIGEVVNASGSKEAMDMLLVNRNKKMALRMDSISHVRNSFFAVGTAHLPGQTGLIRLLQDKGFSVTPVFSSKKIAPEKYTYSSKEIPWIAFAAQDSAYIVQMPGKASDLKMMGEELKFKVYADLVSGITYMSGFSFISNDENTAALTDRMIKSFESKGFEKKEEKKITNRGINGTEMLATLKQVYFRLQFFSVTGKLFIAMAGVEKKENLNTVDIERYFKSFTMNTMLVAKPNTWVDYTNDLKAFEISFPKKPGVDNLKSTEAAQDVETVTCTAMDIPNNTYYLVVINDTKRGFVLSEDSLVFEEKLNYYRKNNSVITDVRKFNYDGNATMSFLAHTKKDGQEFSSKLLIICRGSRQYTIAAVTQKGKEDYPDITRFFRSFKLNPYKVAAWKNVTAHDSVFTAWGPSSFDQALPDTAGLATEEIKYKMASADKLIQFIAHDPNSATSYNIDIKPASKYYFAKNDSIFLDEEVQTFYSDTASGYAKMNPGHFDSLVYKKTISNGNVNGIELLVKNAGKVNYKRVRILPHGDSTYQLFITAPLDLVNNENNNRFFEDFRFTNERPSSGISVNKTSLLLSDLTGKDSLAKEAAWREMNHAKFDSADLPLLFQAYLKSYPVDSAWYITVNEKIGDAISTVHDSSIVTFIRQQYINSTTGLPALKMNMLKVLASQQTKAATLAMKELLVNSAPVKGDPDFFVNKLKDSLQLAAMIFPEASRLFRDSLLGPFIVNLADQLIDSNLLREDILLTNSEAISRAANNQLLQFKKEQYLSYSYPVIAALEKINSKQSVSLLNRFLKLTDINMKEKAALALLKIKQAVSPLELQKIAADNSYRIDFCNALEKIQQERFFPVAFLNQYQFAQGYLSNEIADDEDVQPVYKLIGEKVASIKGVPRRYYIFKVTFNYDEEVTTHLAICGGFELNKKNVKLKETEMAVKIFYEEKYDPSAIDKLYQQFIVKEENGTGSPAFK